MRIRGWLPSSGRGNHPRRRRRPCRRFGLRSNQSNQRALRSAWWPAEHVVPAVEGVAAVRPFDPHQLVGDLFIRGTDFRVLLLGDQFPFAVEVVNEVTFVASVDPKGAGVAFNLKRKVHESFSGALVGYSFRCVAFTHMSHAFRVSSSQFRQLFEMFFEVYLGRRRCRVWPALDQWYGSPNMPLRLRHRRSVAAGVAAAGGLDNRAKQALIQPVEHLAKDVMLFQKRAVRSEVGVGLFEGVDQGAKFVGDLVVRLANLLVRFGVELFHLGCQGGGFGLLRFVQGHGLVSRWKGFCSSPFVRRYTHMSHGLERSSSEVRQLFAVFFHVFEKLRKVPTHPRIHTRVFSKNFSASRSTASFRSSSSPKNRSKVWSSAASKSGISFTAA